MITKNQLLDLAIDLSSLSASAKISAESCKSKDRALMWKGMEAELKKLQQHVMNLKVEERNNKEVPLKTVESEGKTFEAYKSDGECHRESDGKPCFFFDEHTGEPGSRCPMDKYNAALYSELYCMNPTVVWIEKAT